MTAIGPFQSFAPPILVAAVQRLLPVTVFRPTAGEPVRIFVFEA